MAGKNRHPVIVDTDGLIATANTQLWPQIVSTLNLTTTNVCIQELKRHIRERSKYARSGSREQRLYEGSIAALEPFENDSNNAFTVATCVPRPHGEDAGEESIRKEVAQYPDTYRYAILMDREGRIAINRAFEEAGAGGKAIAPPFLLYLLLGADACTKREFCYACGQLLETEGWTGYQAVQAAWEAIPIDCSEFLSDSLLP